MYTRKSKISDAERVRLEEITFCNFIAHLFELNLSPPKIYDFVEVICNLSGCDFKLISDAINIIMTQDRRYLPTREEHVILLSNAGVAVRRVTKELGISQRDYYSIVNMEEPPDILPKFRPALYIEMIKFLNQLEKFIPERKW